jgi:hypothetical protein
MDRQYEDGDYMKVFEEDWRHIVCDKEGNLALDLVARELRDYSLLMQCTSMVYNDILNVSKPFANPECIIKAINQVIDEAAEEAREETRQLFKDGSGSGS